MAATPLTATTLSGLTASTTIASTDLMVADVALTTKKITAGNFRTSMFAFGTADPLNIGPLTATGNSTITGTLSGITTLTASLCSISTGVFTSLSATALALAGALSGVTTLALSGTITSTQDGNAIVTRTGASTNQQFFQLGNTSGSVYFGLESSVGGAFFPGSSAYASVVYSPSQPIQLVVPSGVAYSFGSTALTIGPAVSRIVPGATSLSFRNNANSSDNLLIPDNGAVTFRNGINAGGLITNTTGGFDATGGAAVYKVASTQVLGARKTGYTNPWTGTLERATARDQSTVTLPQLAQRVAALQTDMEAHGIIGV